MALYIIGDLHFTNSHEWDKVCFNRFISYFSELNVEPNSHLLILGDVTDKKINDSQTTDYVSNFFSVALEKFIQIHVIGGNHDMYEDTFKNIYYTTQFLRHFGSHKIHLIYEEEIFNVGGMKIMALPHKKTLGCSIDEYYNSELNNDFYSTEVDLLAGHLSIYDEKMPIAGGLDISKFNYKKAYFGHVHSRVGTHSDKYTGSIMAFKKSENDTDLPRCIVKMTKDSVEEIELPIFKVFSTVDISKNLPEHNKESNPTYVYDFINCNDETAESLKKDYFIRYEKDALDIAEETNEDLNENSLLDQIFENFYEAYLEMCKEMDIHPKRSVNALMKSLLLDDE